MRTSYTRLGRLDLADTVESLVTSMKNLKSSDMVRLKRMGRYLIGVPTMTRAFAEQALPQNLKIYGDSDWVGEMVSRKSTSRLTAMNGTHVILEKCNLQNTIVVSSCETEFDAAVKTLFFEQVTDSSSARGIHGAPRTRHERTHTNKVPMDSGEVGIRRLQAEEGAHTHSSQTDLLTESLSATVMHGHLNEMGFRTDSLNARQF